MNAADLVTPCRCQHILLAHRDHDGPCSRCLCPEFPARRAPLPARAAGYVMTHVWAYINGVAWGAGIAVGYLSSTFSLPVSVWVDVALFAAGLLACVLALSGAKR